MRLSATQIIAAIVCAVGALGIYARSNASEPSSKVSDVHRRGMAEDYMKWVDKREGRGK